MSLSESHRLAMLEPHSGKRRIVIDADTFNEIDDQMELSYQEILALLERLSIPHEGLVHRGVTRYVGREKRPVAAPAVDDLIARARRASPQDPLHVVAIAAIGNVASALLTAPDIIDRIVVIWLGGHAIDWQHQAEFNLGQDIGGVQVLFDSVYRWSLFLARA